MSNSGWNTIDSDAGVFTELVEKLHVKNVQFDDLYAIDSDILKQFEPVYGVVFLFKYSSIDDEYSTDNNKPLDGEYDPNYQESNIFFANQTIQNACATQAVLNILLNKDKDIDIGNELENFKSFVTGFDGVMIGETISNSDLIRAVHNSFSSPSLFIDEDRPKQPYYSGKESGVYHFISYLRINGYIYELDGLKKYPIKHVECKSVEFYEKLPEVIRRRISKYTNELRFSLLAVTNNKIDYYKKINDYELLNNEILKRETWKRENELRRHDYIGLIVELLKNINKDMSDEEWESVLNEARKKGQLSLLQKFARNQNLNI